MMVFLMLNVNSISFIYELIFLDNSIINGTFEVTAPKIRPAATTPKNKTPRWVRGLVWG